MTDLPSVTNQVQRPSSTPGRRYLSAVVSQGIVSGFHFALNVALVKLLSATDYGIFALAFVIAIIASSVSNALIGAPLTVFAPASASEAERSDTEAVLNTAMAYLLGATSIIGLGAVTIYMTQGSTPLVGITLTFFVVSFLARYHGRSVGYARFDVRSVLFADSFYVVVATLALVLVVALTSTPTVALVLAALGLAGWASSAVVMVRSVPRPQFAPRVSLRHRYAPMWLQSKWALVGAVTTMLVSQAHGIVVGAAFGPRAFAPLAAGFIVFGPVRVLLRSMQNVIRPEMALSIASNDDRVIRQAILVSLLAASAVVALAVSMFLAWPLLHSWLYEEEYAAEPMGTIVALWAVVALMAAVQTGPSTLLQAMRAFRPLAMTTVWGSIVSLSLVVAAVYTGPLHRSILAIATAETFVAISVVILVRRHRVGSLPDHSL